MSANLQISSETARHYADYVSNVMTGDGAGNHGIQTFKNEKFGEIRVNVNEQGEPMFCLADVCKALELEQVSRVKSRLKEDGVTISKVTDTLGREQQATFVTEANLYKCIFQSRKPEAEQFQDWVCEDVLPSIRKTGQYAAKRLSPAEQLLANAQLLVDMERRQAEQERRQMALTARQDVADTKIEQIETRIRDNGFMAVIGFANIYHLKLGNNMLKKLGKQCSAWCKRMDILPEKTRHDKWGSVNTYPMQALRDVFKANFPDKTAIFDVPTYWG